MFDSLTSKKVPAVGGIDLKAQFRRKKSEKQLVTVKQANQDEPQSSTETNPSVRAKKKLPQSTSASTKQLIPQHNLKTLNTSHASGFKRKKSENSIKPQPTKQVL